MVIEYERRFVWALKLLFVVLSLSHNALMFEIYSLINSVSGIITTAIYHGNSFPSQSKNLPVGPSVPIVAKGNRERAPSSKVLPRLAKLFNSEDTKQV